MFTTKHNDRNFDVTHAEHIDPAKTHENIYWDWLNGMRTDERRTDVPSFEEVERIFYERHYSDYVAGQCARNASAATRSATEPWSRFAATSAPVRKKPSSSSAKRESAQRRSSY